MQHNKRIEGDALARVPPARRWASKSMKAEAAKAL
jgi:hypothetical protein